MKPIRPRTPGEDWLDAQRGQHHEGANRSERRRMLSLERRTPKAEALETIQQGADTLADLGIDLSQVAPHLAGLFSQKPTPGAPDPEVVAQMQALRRSNPAAFEAARAVFIDTKAAELAALVDEGQRDLALRIVRRQLSGILGDGTVVDGGAAPLTAEDVLADMKDMAAKIENQPLQSRCPGFGPVECDGSCALNEEERAALDAKLDGGDL